jgi:type I restriction enzyme, S subunit
MTSSLTHSAPTTEKKTWKLKDISLKIGSGATPRGGEAAYLKQKVNYAFVRSQNVFDFKFNSSEVRFISDEAAQKLKGVHLQKDDILLNITGDGRTFARCCIVDEEVLPAAVNQHVAIIRLDQQVCLPGYLLAYLCLPETKAYIASFNAGGSRRAITKGYIESFEIPAVPIEKQKVIQDVLFSLISKIDLNQTLNQTLEEIAQAIFKSWFVDFDPVKAKMSGEQPEGVSAETAVLFPKKLVESELGLIPEEWAVGALHDIAKFQNGYAFKGKDLTEDGFPVVKIGSVKPGIVDLQACSYVTEKTVEPLERFKLNVGDILVGMTGYVGETGLVPHSSVAPYMNQRVGRLTPMHQELYELLYVIVRDRKYKQFAEAQAQGSAQANVSGKSLMSYPIVIPPKNIIESFSNLVSPMLKQKLIFFAQSELLAHIRDTLLPKLLSGEIELSYGDSTDES